MSVEGSVALLGAVCSQTCVASPSGHQGSIGLLTTLKFLPVFASSLKSKMPHQKLILGSKFTERIQASCPCKLPLKGVNTIPSDVSMTGSV